MTEGSCALSSFFYYIIFAFLCKWYFFLLNTKKSAFIYGFSRFLVYFLFVKFLFQLCNILLVSLGIYIFTNFSFVCSSLNILFKPFTYSVSISLILLGIILLFFHILVKYFFILFYTFLNFGFLLTVSNFLYKIKRRSLRARFIVPLH